MVHTIRNSSTKWLSLVVTLLILLFPNSCATNIDVNNDNLLEFPTSENTATVASMTPTDTEMQLMEQPTTLAPVPTLERTTEFPLIPLGDLLYVDSNGIAKTDLDTRDVTRISEPLITDIGVGIRNFALSPNQQWLAYWHNATDSSSLNILDIENGNTNVALTLADVSAWSANLFWSADGLYLFLTLEPPSEPLVMDQPTRDILSKRRYYLYSLESGTLQPWDRDCDRLGFSSRTEKIAMWCPSVNENKLDYAVVEWGGEIWLSTEPPDTFLKVRAPEFAVPTWVWSGDGQRVVYADQDRTSPQMLTLATVDLGKPTIQILGDYGLSYAGLNLSADRRYIAFKGECINISPCLLILDSQTSEVIWTSESLGEKNRHLHSHLWHPNENLLLQPVFTDNTYNVFVIDPISGTIERQVNLGDESRFGIGWLP
jgi:hypothetical protein